MLLRICSETFNLTSKVINGELPNVQDGFQIGKGITGQITSICWIVKKQGSSTETLTSASLTMLKIWLCGSQQLGKFLKRWGVQIYLICFLRYLYMGQETTVWMTHETMDWFKIGKKYDKAVYCHPAHLTYIQSTSGEMLGLMKHRLESSLPGEISTASDMYMILL